MNSKVTLETWLTPELLSKISATPEDAPTTGLIDPPYYADSLANWCAFAASLGPKTGDPWFDHFREMARLVIEARQAAGDQS